MEVKLTLSGEEYDVLSDVLNRHLDSLNEFSKDTKPKQIETIKQMLKRMERAF